MPQAKSSIRFPRGIRRFHEFRCFAVRKKDGKTEQGDGGVCR